MYNGVGFLQTEDEETYAKHDNWGGGYDLIDGDCANLPACPLTPSAEDEGIICEADAIAFMVDFENHDEYRGYYEQFTDAEVAAMDFDTRPEGTVSDLDNCKTIYDVYEVVCTGEAEEEEAGCKYEPADECDADWECTDNRDEYHPFIFATNVYDYDCAKLPNCPMVPDSSMGEDYRCESDSVWFASNNGETLFTDASAQSMRPEGTSGTLNNCYSHDVYKVVGTCETAEEVTTAESGELCETYVTAASCPASYCVIKNDRNGAFKKCKRVQCKSFSADEAACEASAECYPKYKFGAFINKCLLKKNLV
jgi:hypothetical protein